MVTLIECRSYAVRDDFDADLAAHLNDPSWFDPAGLFGFVLEGARPVPFVRAVGNVRLFTVEVEEPLAAPPPEVLRRLSRLARTREQQRTKEG